MTTKFLTGAYPGGYALSAAYTGLVIENSASVGGSGVYASFEAEVRNYGVVSTNNGYGVRLAAGGSVVNGSAKDTTALIAGVYVRDGSATIVNYGTFTGGFEGVSFGHGTGTVINGSATDTTALLQGGFGILALYGSATVTNYGTIYAGNASIEIAGGTVTNGSLADTAALISSYVEVWSSSTINNFGTIHSRILHSGGYDGVGIDLNGGIVLNGAPNDTTALIKGIYCYGSSASIANFGTIEAYGSTGRFGGVSIYLYAGGAITNGSKSVYTALIEGGTGVILQGPATLTNFGTISGSGGDAVIFKSAAETLQIEPGSHLVGAASGFSDGDTIDLAHVAATQATYANGQLTVTNGPNIVRQIEFTGNFQEATFDLTNDGAGGKNIVLGPSELILAEIAAHAYTQDPASLVGDVVGGFNFREVDPNFISTNNFLADYYVDAATKQIIIGFRGTDFPHAGLGNVGNILADLAADSSFVSHVPTPDLLAYLGEAASFVSTIENDLEYKNYDITLTGHSLGGAIAQMLGLASGLPAVGFDAPGGGGTLYNNPEVQAALAPVIHTPFDTGVNLDISMAGDQISNAGTLIGTGITLPSNIAGLNPNNYNDVVANIAQSHSYQFLIDQLQANVNQILGRPYLDVEPQLVYNLQNFGTLSNFYKDVANAQAIIRVTSGTPNLICAAPVGETDAPHAPLSAVTEEALAGIPPAPAGANEYAFVGQTGSPDIGSLVLPVVAGVTSYEVSTHSQGGWSAATSEQPNSEITFASGVTGLRFWGVNAEGQAVALPINDDFFLQVTFAKSGTFTGTLSEVLGAVQWVGGSGDWSTGSNWSGGASPGPGTGVTISAAGTYSVTISAAIEESLIDIHHAQATVVDSGSLTLDESMTVSAGRFDLASSGVVSGGTIAAAGGTFVWAGGTLDDVTYQGTLSLAGKSASLSVTGQLLATDSSGAGPGDIILTGAQSELSFVGQQTFDNATVAIGSASAGGPATLYNADPQATGGALTLGPQLIVEQSGLYAAIGGSTANAADGVVSDGTIDADVSGGRFVISALNFTNGGGIAVSNGDDLLLQPSAFTNLSGTILTGGSLEVDQGSTMQLAANAVVATDNATIILSGAGSTIESLNSTSHTEVQIDGTLATIGAAGTLELLGGRNWTTALTLSNAGALDLGGGTLMAKRLANTGTVSGFGAITAPIANSGSILAAGGGLDLARAITGAGAMSIDSGAALGVDGMAAATLAMTFNGANAVLALKAPSAFGATINGFALTDAIDLVGKTATSAVLGAGDTLVITNKTRSVATLQLAGTYTGDTFTTISDGNGGTDIMISSGEAVSLPSSQRFVDAMASLSSPAPGAGWEFRDIGEAQTNALRGMLGVPRLTQIA